MSVTNAATSLKNRLNAANPNELASYLQAIKFGDVLRSLPTTLHKQDPAAQSYQLASLEALTLPDSAKARTIARATVRAGGVTGELAVKLYGVTPGSGEIAVAPNGDIVFLASDAITDVDVVYNPEIYDIVELDQFPVVASVLTIPTAYTTLGVKFLMEAEVIAGGVTGKKIIFVPGTAPATTKANLNVAKTQVLFNVATDLVTKARVKFAVAPGTNVNALLEADASFY